MARGVWLALVLALCLVPVRALAHQSSIAYSTVNVGDDGRVAWTVQVAARDLYEALALDRDREATDEEIRTGEARLVAYVGGLLRVANGERACPLAARGVELVHRGDRYAKVRFEAACGAPVQLLVLDYDLFFDLDPAHVGMLEVTHAGETVRRELTTNASRFEWDLTGEAPVSTSFADFVASGVEHIFVGYDHICFLLGLLLVAGLLPRREATVQVLKTVTAFTVAHSLTLVAAALGWVSLPSRLVESAIAASIVYVAVENIVVRAPRNRWPLAFGFGLVHGLGFASVLQPLLPPSGIVVPLLAFNLGVEIGQLAIVTVVLPVLLIAAGRSRAGYRRVVIVGGSVVVGALGFLWLVERVFDVQTLSRWL